VAKRSTSSKSEITYGDLPATLVASDPVNGGKTPEAVNGGTPPTVAAGTPGMAGVAGEADGIAVGVADVTAVTDAVIGRMAETIHGTG
jgi:hypothetical protein